ncbi:hypothetical protein PR048_007164 [Dryococelus australis]|uniref:DDE Tnp4 domain-containing protein n=1 Tax=Dryococelus australis TaxID=614101 RepID=A0ABQ9ICV5_9NEOP|nr:hypothetical protein PR048_007164 [Dryococelus australis]
MKFCSFMFICLQVIISIVVILLQVLGCGLNNDRPSLTGSLLYLTSLITFANRSGFRVKPVCFPQLTEELWLQTAAQFYQRTNFPNCMGALDGKQVRIVKPAHSSSFNYNYNNFSVLLLAMCDASIKLLFM